MASISIPDPLLGAVRAAAGDDHVEAFVEQAIEAALRNRDLDSLIAALIDEVGPVPPELVAEADAAWRAS